MNKSPDVFIMRRPGTSTDVVLGEASGDAFTDARRESEHRANYRTDTEPVGQPEILIVPDRDE